ncbi:hypothetical protein HZ326_3137 [Fusarium oxysporum f. sp. albedinis]|nr:hypothetical protein HZ326_3137 [Fusarium oxysporum f. sp. albedinis]
MQEYTVQRLRLSDGTSVIFNSRITGSELRITSSLSTQHWGLHDSGPFHYAISYNMEGELRKSVLNL